MNKYLIVYETLLYDYYVDYIWAPNKKEALKKYKEKDIYKIKRIVAIRKITKKNIYL